MPVEALTSGTSPNQILCTAFLSRQDGASSRGPGGVGPDRQASYLHHRDPKARPLEESAPLDVCVSVGRVRDPNAIVEPTPARWHFPLAACAVSTVPGNGVGRTSARPPWIPEHAVSKTTRAFAARQNRMSGVWREAESEARDGLSSPLRDPLAMLFSAQRNRVQLRQRSCTDSGPRSWQQTWLSFTHDWFGTQPPRSGAAPGPG